MNTIDMTEFATAAIHRKGDPMGILDAATRTLRLVLGGAATPILADVAANEDNPSALRVAASGKGL